MKWSPAANKSTAVSGELSTYTDKLHPGKMCVTVRWVCACCTSEMEKFLQFQPLTRLLCHYFGQYGNPKSAYRNVLIYLKFQWLFCQTARVKISHLNYSCSTVLMLLMHNETREEKQSCGRYLLLFLALHRAFQQHYQLQPRWVSSILKNTLDRSTWNTCWWAQRAVGLNSSDAVRMRMASSKMKW